METTQRERALAYDAWTYLREQAEANQTPVDLSPLYALFPDYPKSYVRRMTNLEGKKRERSRQQEQLLVSEAEEIPGYALEEPARPAVAGPPRGERAETEMERDGNYLLTSITNAGSIKSIDDLIAAVNLDPAVWRVDDTWQVRTWPTTGGSPEPWSVRNWYVRAQFVRVEPEPVFPAVQPVAITLPPLPPAPPRPVGRLQTAVFLPDPQFGFRRDMYTGRLDPFHDRRALSVALKLLAAIRPDRVVWLGDLLDLPDWSDRFIRSPEFYWATQPAILEASWWLAQCRLAAPDAEIDALEGNHDKRLQDALVAHLPAAYELRPTSQMELPPQMSVPHLLDLDGMGIAYHGAYPDGEVWLNPRLLAIHGDVARSGLGATVTALLKKHDVTVVQGHIHRIELLARASYAGRGQGTLILGMSPGCLCRLDGAVPGHSPRTQNWQQGIGVGFYDPEGDEHAVYPVSIVDGRAVYNGATFEADDEVEIVEALQCSASEAGWPGRFDTTHHSSSPYPARDG